MAKRHKPKYAQQGGSSATPIIIGLVAVMVVLVAISLGLRMMLNAAYNSDPQPTAPADDSYITEATVPPEVSTVPKITDGQEELKKPSLWQRLFGAKETEPEPTQAPEPEHVVSRASISITGDILMHMPVINTGLQADGSYDFSSIFRYLQPYTAGADYAIANLETTLAGTGGGYKYSGYPAFNCPDEIVTALKGAGFDMLLTANNHCYDTSEYGFLRTVKTVRSLGLETLGTRASADEPVYTIQEFDGIKVGMVCYTYEGQPENPTPGVIYMNKNALSTTCAPLINSFLTSQLDPFYMDLRQILEEMKQAGADATVMLIHWGTEYQTTPSGDQRNIAQQLCDLGFDVIVGGHPHVIQPVELLTSRLDPEHKTICLYSTGNAVSNQRIAEMDLKTGHTEDALLFTMTFSRYSDDTVYLEDVELLPCWVDMRTDGQKEYVMIPLDDSIRSQWQADFGLTAEALENAEKSYTRTTELTGAGMTQARDYLAQQKLQREADYLAAVTPAAPAA